jgi:hypothetical protein
MDSRHTPESFAMKTCIDAGIKVYPVYFERSQFVNGTKYLSSNWHIQVDNNGRIITYDKSIGKGTPLMPKKPKKKEPTWDQCVMKVYVHWAELITKNKYHERKSTQIS